MKQVIFGNSVILLEKMDSLGKKLLITGKGRCNITSSLPIEDFIQNVPGNGIFLYSSFNNFTNKDIIKMLEEEGLKVKEERGHRIFPITDSSKDVLNVLVRLLKRSNVKIETNAKVEKILTENEKIVGVQAVIDGKVRTINADKVILATGGMSYPVTGSNGDGYELAKELGHTITKIKPSLIPLTAQRESLEICKELQGLSLINVSIKLIDTQKNKIIYDDFGEMLFTHWGVSGPIILSGSAHLLRYKNVEELLKEGKIELSINLKPALTEEKLENRILRDFEAQKNKEFKNSLNELLPKKLIEPIIRMSGIDENKKVNSITKQERKNLVKLLQDFRIKINGFRPINEAIVTSGGISVKEINPKTMESKIIHGLYFAGEIIDVDAYTGGFNLQIAWSTGYTAGM
ncbi:flavoprotein HI0933 family [Clostridium sp. CAG:567]|nr:flavoprotein HI0933 family [Clostridium sp. CAG:567]